MVAPALTAYPVRFIVALPPKDEEDGGKPLTRMQVEEARREVNSALNRWYYADCATHR